MKYEQIIFFGFLGICLLWWIGHLGSKTKLGFWTSILFSLLLTPVGAVILIVVLMIINKRNNMSDV